MKEGAERREKNRVIFSVPVKITEQKTDRKFFCCGLSKDISPTGVGLECSENLNVGELYKFEIFFNDGQIIQPEGKIVWAKIKNDRVYYGVEFSKMGIVHKLKLVKQIKVDSKIQD